MAVRLVVMRRRWDGAFVVAFLAAGLAATGVECPVVAQDQPAVTVPCGGEPIAHGTASKIVDGRTFILDDGREVRLAAIEVPQPGNAGATASRDAASDGLTALAAGDEVIVRRIETGSDRYGRLFGYAYTLRDGDTLFVQAEMIGAGLARVGGRIGDKTCAAELLKRETAARRAKLGLWADPYYDVLDAATPAAVLAQQGRFALVEGEVASVRESGATIYVNFGQRWSDEFAVTVLKRNERNFAAAGLDLRRLEGRRIRVRGVVEARSGPWIEAAHPEQIELTEGD
jgi:endonuclease YncB( thermonuclease family)